MQDKIQQKEIRVGTKTLGLVVAYSGIRNSTPANQDPEISFSISRGFYNLEESKRLDLKWTDEEIDIAIPKAITELKSRRIQPSNVRSFVDDRYGELSDTQKQRFLLRY